MIRPTPERIPYILLACLLPLLLPPGPAPAEETAPRCALVVASDFPVAKLLEARLLARSSETWLERSEIDRILAEKELQGAFGAAEGANRASFGQILKADVLVLVREIAQNKEQAAELVVAESNGGLRLLAQTVSLTDDAEGDAARLEELVAAGLARHGEAIREIYAVPPFVNDDLGLGHDHLKEAYAKVLEQAILSEPGMLVVELAEAEALAQEYGLAAAADGPSRPLPCYVLGSFRHEGYGEKQTVTITIQVKRGEQQLQELKETLSPGQDPSFLRKTAAELLQSGDRSAVVADPAKEARELAKRGNVFLTLGNWPEAMALYEASLLLEPNRPEVRCKATHAAVERVRKATRKPEEVADAIRLYCRAFEHCEALFRTDEREAFATAIGVYSGCVTMRGEKCFDSMRRNPAIPADCLAQYESLVRAEAELVEELKTRKFLQPEWKSIAPPIFDIPVGFPDEEYAKLAAFVVKHQDALKQEVVSRMLPGGRNSLERRRFLQNLADSETLADEIRNTAKTQLSQFEEQADWLYAVPSRDKEPTPGPEPTDTLTVLPIKLSCLFKGQEVELSTLYCKALDNGIDLCWGPTYQNTWLPLTKLPKGDGLPQVLCPEISSPEAVVWDGKYAWILNGGRLWVVEPIGGDCWEITEEHGMPVMSKGPADPIGRPTARVVVPLGNDEAIVAGDLGQAWVAHVRFNPDGRHQVRVIHEAREELPTGARSVGRVRDVYENAWKNPRLACSCVNGMVLDAGGEEASRERRVLIRRSHGQNSTLAKHPLVVNPKDLSIGVLEAEYKGGLTYRGKCLFSGFGQRVLRWELQSAAYPDFEPEEVIPEIDKGRLLLHEDSLQIVGAKWWQVDLLTREKKCLGTVPWNYSEHYRSPKAGDLEMRSDGSSPYGSIGYSNRFGWYANCQEHGGVKMPVQMRFDGSGMSLREVIPKTASSDEDEEKPSTSRLVARRPPRKEMLWNRNGNRYYTDLAYSPDGSLIVTTSHLSPCVQVWDAATGLLIADLVEHSDSMRSVRFDRSGKYFATAGAEESMFLWSAETLELVHHAEGMPRKVSGGPSLAFSWDGSLLAVCKDTRPSSATVWNTEDGTQKKKIEIVRVHAGAVEFTPDRRCLFTFGPWPGETSMWNLETGKTAGTIETLHHPLGFLPDGELLAIAPNLQRSLIAWDFERNTYRVVWERSPRNVLAVSPNGKYLLESWGSLPRSMEPSSVRYALWDIENKTELGVTRGAVNAQDWRISPDGKNVVAVAGTTLWRWDLTRRPAQEQMRTWADASGQFHVEAAFEKLTRDGVRLKRKDGPSVLVPLEKLSDPCREFLASIPTDELTPRGSSSREDLSEPGEDYLEHFGQPVDPDGDCQFGEKRWRLTIDVPGTLHDLRSELGKMNAPRVVRHVDSDFKVYVDIDGDFAPKTGVIDGQPACHSAGIVAMQDEKTYLRVEHSAVKRPGQDKTQHFVRVQFRRNGAIVPGCDRSYYFEEADIINVGLERRGSEFIPSFQGRRTGIQPLPSIRILLPPDLTVGLTAVNTSSEPFSPEFIRYFFFETK